MSIDATKAGYDYEIIFRDGSRTVSSIRSFTDTVHPSGFPGVIFNEGGHGAYVFTPRSNFLAFVDTWGAGAGIHSCNGSTLNNSRDSGGYGGWAHGLVRFEKDIPYTIIIGQRGTRNNDNNNNVGVAQGGRSFGGGGRGHGGGASGAGLSGLFYNASHHCGPFNTATFPANTWPLSGTNRSNALLIAGGGGGGGHVGNSHHGVGGGGGGWRGEAGHNVCCAGQSSGGNHWTSGAQSGYELHGGHAGNSSVCGGGGGGWYGGGGGAHAGSQSHHNGGGGGSGHVVNPSSNGGNSSLSNKVLFGTTEASAIGYHSAWSNRTGTSNDNRDNQFWYNPARTKMYSTNRNVSFVGNSDVHPYVQGSARGAGCNEDNCSDGRFVITLAPDQLQNRFNIGSPAFITQ